MKGRQKARKTQRHLITGKERQKGRQTDWDRKTERPKNKNDQLNFFLGFQDMVNV